MDAEIETYRRLLKAHDWSYEYSDDHSVWLRGKEERRKLREMQAQLDPDRTIWTELAPKF